MFKMGWRRMLLESLLLFLTVGRGLCNPSKDASGLSLDLDLQNGDYRVKVNNQDWLISADPFVTVNGKTLSKASGDFGKGTSRTIVGDDGHGPYHMTTISYDLPQASSNRSRIFRMMFKTYDANPFMLLFGQDFHGADFTNTSVGDANKLSSGFPSFLVEKSLDLGYLAFGGYMIGDRGKKIGKWNTDAMKIASGLDSGPLILFTGDYKSALVVSPFNHFMAMSAVYSKGVNGEISASWGLMGKLDSIPEHTHAWTIMYYSDRGINRAMYLWGSALRNYYGKDDAYVTSDFSINYLGYWTDNGAYYYYKTVPTKNYEDTIIDVKKDSDQKKIPYRYVQYDSWWYYKIGGGVSEWYSLPNVFPDGMQYVWNQTGLPVVAHNRWWSAKTVYAKQNGGKYNFIVEADKNKAIPMDGEFWGDLLRDSKKWGLIVYEQDWLNTEFNSMDATVSDIHVGRDWLRQMGNGARKNGMTVQYCMATSRHTLQSLEIPSVTQARVSDDYHPGNQQWKIGISSIFAHAVGLSPFKDNFWSTSNQTDSPYGSAVEPSPELQSLVATISTGPVGPSDKVGSANVKLIMKTCNAEGLILKPERPARALDSMIVDMAFKGFSGEVWSTHTYISGFMFGIILGADFGASDKISVTPQSAGFEHENQLPSSVVFSHKSKQDALFSNSNPLLLAGCTITDFCLYYVSPVLIVGGKELIIYGEMGKWVPMSKQRVKNIMPTGDPNSPMNVKIEIEGAVGETVSFYMSYGGENIEFKCQFYEGGTRIIDFMERKCVYN